METNLDMAGFKQPQIIFGGGRKTLVLFEPRKWQPRVFPYASGSINLDLPHAVGRFIVGADQHAYEAGTTNAVSPFEKLQTLTPAEAIKNHHRNHPQVI